MDMIEENALRARLDRELDQFTAGSAPVDGVMRQGRGIRTRRRAVFGGTLAVIAMVAVAVPVALVHGTAPSRPVAAPVRHSVTVDPPAPGGPAGVIASGTADGEHWKVTAGSGAAGQVCFAYAVDDQTGSTNCGTKEDVSSSSADPVDLEGGSDGALPYFSYGPVRADVARVVVDFADGESLDLRPVTVLGQRDVGFAQPQGLRVTRLSAYAASGSLIAYVIPYDTGSAEPSFVQWYQPTQVPTQATVSGQIVAGHAGGRAYAVTVHLGPFGECFTTSGILAGNSACSALTVPPVSQDLSSMILSGDPLVMVGELNPQVDHLVAKLSDGTSVTVRPVGIGGRSFGALVVAKGIQVLSVTSYDSAGKQLARDTKVVSAS